MDRSTVFTVDEIRHAEQPLLDAEHRPDELMQSAAAGVATAARMMLRRTPVPSQQEWILLAVGAGGNGGDALYAGRDLLADGWRVEAVLLGRDRVTGEPRAHTRALAAFTAAGGQVVEDPATLVEHDHRLLIDGILGMGGSGGLWPEAAGVLARASARRVPVLSVDVPSGVDADTGAVADAVALHRPGSGEEVPSHAVADVTVTFGGLRRAHAVSGWCGQVLLADPGLDSGGTIGASLAEQRSRQDRPPVSVVRAQVAAVPLEDPRQFCGDSGCTGAGDPAGTGLVTVGRAVGRDGVIGGPREPGPSDDKYTGGVVGICAGSDRFPGAAVLATTGAVRATSAMVRYIGSGASEVIRVCPEVVWAPTVEESGRVQAWAVGPGRGTGDDAAAELATLLDRPEPLLIDADALTLLAQRPELRRKLLRRSPDPRGAGDADAETLLTPHAGEFRRLVAALGEETGGTVVPDPDADRIGAASALAAVLHCSVLLKGRYTVTVERPLLNADGTVGPTRVTCIDAGTSWGATPGSGDVLSGITGALIAQWAAGPGAGSGAVAPRAAALHALAACIAAHTPDGYAPTSASRIADAVPRAWAQAGAPYTVRW